MFDQTQENFQKVQETVYNKSINFESNLNNTSKTNTLANETLRKSINNVSFKLNEEYEIQSHQSNVKSSGYAYDLKLEDIQKLGK
jgi:hypothetical protein